MVYVRCEHCGAWQGVAAVADGGPTPCRSSGRPLAPVPAAAAPPALAVPAPEPPRPARRSRRCRRRRGPRSWFLRAQCLTARPPLPSFTARPKKPEGQLRRRSCCGSSTWGGTARASRPGERGLLGRDSKEDCP
jgi:hypothetical protein